VGRIAVVMMAKAPKDPELVLIDALLSLLRDVSEEGGLDPRQIARVVDYVSDRAQEEAEDYERGMEAAVESINAPGSFSEALREVIANFPPSPGCDCPQCEAKRTRRFDA
jgi:hypothetical protein